MHPGSGHPTNAGRRFNNATNSGLYFQRNLTQPLRDPQGCNSCNDRGVGFYRYTRSWQLNNMSTGHGRDEYREQYGRSAGWVQVNIISTPCEEFGSTRSEELRWTPLKELGLISGCVWSNCVIGQLVASKADQCRVWSLDSLWEVGSYCTVETWEMSADTHKTPGERSSWSASGTCWVCDLWLLWETGSGNCGHESMKSVDSSTVRTRKHY